MRAQEFFRKYNYSVSDNRNIEWRAINKILEYGIEMNVATIGHERINSRGFSWKIALRFGSCVSYYKAKSLNVFVNGEWHSNTSSEVAKCVLDCLINFREVIIENGYKEILLIDSNSQCMRCNGSGINNDFIHINNGICYDCYGFGLV